MKICLISNKPDLKENYSDFIDSCDKVVRINKMDNLHSGLTGAKTDIVFTVTCRDYFRYSRKFRNVDVLRKAEVFFTPQTEFVIKQYVARECIKNWHILKSDPRTDRWTTTSTALYHLTILYPDEKIYFLGDTQRMKRSPGILYHNKPKIEEAFFSDLIEKKILIPILGNHDYMNK